MVLLIMAIVSGCSKKSHPSKTTVASVDYNYTPGTPAETEKVSTETKRTVVRRNQKTVFPKVIMVNDEAAHKSVDGRLYYDVEGHRYWRNYKDGKYYLFNKSMYKDPAFNKID